jgi:phenylacetate-CoA ligase
MQSTLVRNVIYPLHEKFMGRDTFANLAGLEHLQLTTAAELADLRLRKLRELLLHAKANIPFYAERFTRAGFDPKRMQSFDDLKALPLLTKNDIKQHRDEMLWRDCPGGLYRYNTGGSSGEPLIFYFDKRRQGWDKAARMLTHRWWGVEVGDREFYLWGSPLEETRQDRMKDWRDRLTNELLVSAFEVSPANVPKIYTAMQKFRPKCLFGYPSTIDLFAQIAAKQGLNLPNLRVEVVFATAELLYDHQRQSISTLFGGIPVADGYGSREGGFVAHECVKGRYHVMDPNYVVEFIRDGLPAQAGEDGEIIITHLDAWGMPLIRYCTGDVAQPGEGSACPCGCSFSTMQQIRGRTTDFVVTPDGRWQHALSVIYVVRDIEGVDEFKIVQYEVEDVQVLVKIIPELYPANGNDRIVAGIRKRMGDSVKVRVEHVEAIPREASGKHRYVVSHVAQKGL